MSGYDIIGDVHGCADMLVALLITMGYVIDDATGAYGHSERQAIFVGDLVDRGEGQLQVLETVKRMVDHGTAQIVMGNHEFNAVAYATEHPLQSGDYLWPHTAKNTHQHEGLLAQVTGTARDHYLEWFTTLPLWLDRNGIRIVHACWHQPSIDFISKELGSNRFNSPNQFVRASDKTEPLYTAIEIILKGPELSLRNHGQPPYVDKDGNARNQACIRWWNEGGTTLLDLAELSGRFTTADGAPYPPLPAIPVSDRERSFAYGGDVPVVYGHNWRQGTPTQGDDWSRHTACVDFSVVKGGALTAYQRRGVSEINPAHYKTSSDTVGR
ncbi:metallophosphoesterase [soil metagenome]